MATVRVSSVCRRPAAWNWARSACPNLNLSSRYTSRSGHVLGGGVLSPAPPWKDTRATSGRSIGGPNSTVTRSFATPPGLSIRSKVSSYMRLANRSTSACRVMRASRVGVVGSSSFITDMRFPSSMDVVCHWVCSVALSPAALVEALVAPLGGVVAVRAAK